MRGERGPEVYRVEYGNPMGTVVYVIDFSLRGTRVACNQTSLDQDRVRRDANHSRQQASKVRPIVANIIVYVYPSMSNLQSTRSNVCTFLDLHDVYYSLY